jgi:hypothetical protein
LSLLRMQSAVSRMQSESKAAPVLKAFRASGRYRIRSERRSRGLATV